MTTPTSAESLSLADLAAECKRLAIAYGQACHNAGFSFKFNETCRVDGDKRIAAAWGELAAELHRLASLASPSVTVPADEQAAFEAWADNYGISRFEETRNAYFIPWQARAAVAVPTVVPEPPACGPLYRPSGASIGAAADAQDAKRYRWLRDALDNEEVTAELHEAFQLGAAALDAAIDAAIANAVPPIPQSSGPTSDGVEA